MNCLSIRREVFNHIITMMEEPGPLIDILCSEDKNIDKSDCFDCVYTLLKKSRTFKRIFSETKILKSNDTAVKYRMTGNEMYRAKRYTEALKCYTESIKFAENDSSNLGLAFANRSAVLFEKKYYKECLEDIQRAFESNYPDQLKYKLLKRRRDAESLKQNQKPLDYYGNTPHIINKNPVIDAASDAVQVQTNKKFGRHIIATRDIKIGELIAVEKPYVQIVHPKHRLFYCNECFKLCYNMIPCTSCTTALYCSKNCKTKAFTTFHRYECNFVEYFHKQPILFMKMVIVGLQDSGINDNTGENTYSSNRFKEIKALSTNEDKRTLQRLSIFSLDTFLLVAIACFSFHCLKSNKDFCLEFDLENNQSLIMELLYKCVMIESCNEFAIGKVYESGETVYFGEAIYAFVSLFNHSCTPNFDSYFYGSDIVIRANANVKKGEQCTISYGVTYHKKPVGERRALLEKSYHFSCDCRACINNWPTIQHLPLGNEIPDSFYVKEALISLFGLNEVILKDLLTEASNIYDFLKLEEPCQNMCLLKSCILSVFKNMNNQCFQQLDEC